MVKVVNKYKIKFYKKQASGKEPVNVETERYLRKVLKNEKLKKKYLLKLKERYTRLEVNGTSDGKPAFDNIKNTDPKIEEIRFSFNQIEHRIFISLCKKNNTYVLLHYLIGKKTQTTPKADIDKSVARMKEYLSRLEEE